MASLKDYLELLVRLTESCHLKIQTKIEGGVLVVDKFPFKMAKRQALKDLPSFGLLVPSLTSDERYFCEQFRLSYLTLDGQFQLYQNDVVLRLEETKKPQRASKKKSAQSRKQVTPTLLISPYALAILDALFRVPEDSLKNVSGLAFAKKFQLYQPKLSKIMRELGAQDLIDLKAKIRNLPESWWQLAWLYPGTRKGFTPFFEVAKPYHSVDQDKMIQQDYKKTVAESNFELIPGPVEVGKSVSVLVDADYYFWGSESAIRDIKSKFRLVPGRSMNGPTWHLATPSRDLRTESIVSRLVTAQPGVLQGWEHANIFRAIWDLSFGSERLQEVRMNLLRQVLK